MKPRRLKSSDRLKIDPRLQAAALPGGGVLLRGSFGVSALAGLPFEDMTRTLEAVNGARSVAEICALAADRHDYEPDAVAELLAQLAGTALTVMGDPPPEMHEPPEPAVKPGSWQALVLGAGALAQSLGARLNEIGVSTTPVDWVDWRTPAPADGFWRASPKPPAGEIKAWPLTELTPRLGGANLVICAMESAAYAELYEAQRLFLAVGAPALFITIDPDGARVGPLCVPGHSACFACAQRAGLGFLQDRGLAVEPVARLMETERIDEWERPADLVAAAVAEASATRHANRRPASINGLRLLSRDGSQRRFPIAWDPDCPLCAEIEPGAGDTPLASIAQEATVAAFERAPIRTVPDSPQEPIASVGILGGGTAGYLAALALRQKTPTLKVTLIESSKLPIIGVGEATTPLMPQFLHVDLGLDIHSFWREVQPTFKLGIRFDWGETSDARFHYPFGPVRPLEPFLFEDSALNCSLRSMMMSADRLPLDLAAGRCRLGLDTAYHLDNRRFAAYLRRQAERRGVARIDTTITDAALSEDGESIAALIDEDGRRHTFDLYLDCSGFRAELIGGKMGSPFLDFKSSLFADRAIVAATPHGGRVKPYTTAEAMSAGWCWNTPQPEEDHRGYVFCSAFQDDEAAAAEMRAKNPAMGDWRVTPFRTGRRAHFWKGNVVALGNAYGFVEPLESTALHMLIRQIGALVRAFHHGKDGRGAQAVLNRRIGNYWDYLRWFLTIHYKFNRAMDTAFWSACRADADVSSHAELLASFHRRGPLSYDPEMGAAFDYPDPLWGAEGVDTILLGQRAPTRPPRPAWSRAAWLRWKRASAACVQRAADHGQASAALADQPELLNQFAAAFQRVGPAF